MKDNEIYGTYKMDDNKIIFREESYLILGACFEVYREKGNGFLEAVYQECLQKEFEYQKIPFKEKPKLQITYKSSILKQYYEPDFLCYDKIILEIKAVKTLTIEHKAQIINYLKATDLSLGILVNFGHFPKIEYKRIVK
jgi:GxxExxY protein